jgi:hypothetical protein
MRKNRPGKNSWSQPLAEFVHTAIGPVAARQGFGQSDLFLFWEAIAGERLAAISQPVKLQWPPRRQDHAADNGTAPATLIIRVESGFALEMQHLAPVIIERVNAHFGWRCVVRIALKQGPLEARPPARRAARVPDKGAEMAAEALAGGITEAPLREALTRLGARVLAGM